jgi:hypothetical protein
MQCSDSVHIYYKGTYDKANIPVVLYPAQPSERNAMKCTDESCYTPTCFDLFTEVVIWRIYHRKLYAFKLKVCISVQIKLHIIGITGKKLQ